MFFCYTKMDLESLALLVSTPKILDPFLGNPLGLPIFLRHFSSYTESVNRKVVHLMKKKTLLLGLVAGVLAGATVYTLKKLDWFHDDAKDYAIFESQRS